MPFDLISIDSEITNFRTDDKLQNDTDNEQNDKKVVKKVTIFENIIEICKLYMNQTTKCNEAAALIIAKFFTRPDIHQTTLL